MCSSRVVFALGASVSILLCAQSSPAIVNGTDVPCWDRRFDGVGVLLSVSAPGACPGAVSGSCVLVGPNQVLCARHQLGVPANVPLPTLQQHPLRVRFRRAISGASSNMIVVAGEPCHGVYQEIDVVGVTDAAIAGGDMVLLTLAAEPVGIVPIGVEIDHPPIRPTEIIIAGWGYGGSCLASAPSWGLREARGVMPDQGQYNDVLAFSICSLGSIEPCVFCPAGTGATWVLANQHDSGGAVLIEVPTQNPAALAPELRLVGVIVAPWAARRPGAWNTFGGRPQLRQAAPTPPADFDGNGIADTHDLLDFLNAFWRSDCRANITGGPLDAADIFAFLNAFFDIGG